MPIITDQTNSSPMPIDGYVHKNVFGLSSVSQQTPVSVITSLTGCEGCNCDGCKKNIALAELVYSDPNKNDKFKFFGISLQKNGNIEWYLQKDGVDVTQITDQSFGELKEPGDFPSQESLGSLYLDWQVVLATYGTGCYNMRIVTDKLGGGTEEEISPIFDLQIYHELRAQDTVRFTWNQNGQILDNSIDFTGLDIEQQIRVNGNIGYSNDPRFTKDYHEQKDHKFIQNQAQMEFRYPFQSEDLNFFSTFILLKDIMLADKISVTSYNYYNHWPITDLEVEPGELQEVKDFEFNKCASVKILFEEQTRDTIKRNFK